jgi:outer membrane protein insertion porin family
LIRARAVRLAFACLLPLLFVGSAFAQPRAAPPPAARSAPATAPVRGGGTVAAIKVEGNQRIESGTIISYMLVQPGDLFDPDRLDRSQPRRLRRQQKVDR